MPEIYNFVLRFPKLLLPPRGPKGWNSHSLCPPLGTKLAFTEHLQCASCGLCFTPILILSPTLHMVVIKYVVLFRLYLQLRVARFSAMWGIVILNVYRKLILRQLCVIYLKFKFNLVFLILCGNPTPSRMPTALLR